MGSAGPVAAELSLALEKMHLAPPWYGMWSQGKKKGQGREAVRLCAPGMYSLSSEKSARASALYVRADTALLNPQPLGYFLINYSLL